MLHARHTDVQLPKHPPPHHAKKRTTQTSRPDSCVCSCTKGNESLIEPPPHPSISLGSLLWSFRMPISSQGTSCGNTWCQYRHTVLICSSQSLVPSLLDCLSSSLFLCTLHYSLSSLLPLLPGLFSHFTFLFCYSFYFWLHFCNTEGFLSPSLPGGLTLYTYTKIFFIGGLEPIVKLGGTLKDREHLSEVSEVLFSLEQKR